MASAEAWGFVRILRDRIYRREPTDEDWAELIDEIIAAAGDIEWETEDGENAEA